MPDHQLPATPAPALGAAVLLADELAMHLLFEYLALNLPGFAESMTSQLETLAASQNIPPLTQTALNRLRDYIASTGGEPVMRVS